MIIRKLTAYAVKAGTPYIPTGAATPGTPLPGSDYYQLGAYPQLYSRRSQAAVIKVETDDGLVGWGEAQAPIGTEVVLALVREVLGPAVLGRNAESTAVRYDEMYQTLRVRGHSGGFQLDAIAGIDTALWDLRGKLLGRSIAELLGGARCAQLPGYVTGLRAPTREARIAEAAEWHALGLGVKSCLGTDVRADLAEIGQLRSALGDEALLLVDALWQYSWADAVRAGRGCHDLGVGFLEAPLAPEDLAGHQRLAERVDVPIAVGEALRHRSAFLPWFCGAAMGVAQPDLMRNGVTETVRIAQLAEAFHLPVGLHLGCSTVIGAAATWQVAATLPNHLVQEVQPVMLEQFNPWLAEPLRYRGGPVVPTDPGLGIDVDQERVAAESTSRVEVVL